MQVFDQTVTECIHTVYMCEHSVYAICICMLTYECACVHVYMYVCVSNMDCTRNVNMGKIRHVENINNTFTIPVV